MMDWRDDVRRQHGEDFPFLHPKGPHGEATLYEKDLDHGFLGVDHDPEEPDGLYIVAAAHAATGYAFVPRAELERLGAIIWTFLHNPTDSVVRGPRPATPDRTPEPEPQSSK